MKTIGVLLLYLFSELLAAVVEQHVTSETYQWTTGSWSACDRHTKCGEGHKVRRVWCKNSSGYIVSNSNCNSSQRPSTTKQCFTVCDHHKFVLRWRVGEWSPCTVKTIRNCSDESTNLGVARRSVECVLSSTHLVVDNEACEYFWDKPDSEMACSVDCPQNCITTRRNITCQLQECSDQISWTEEVHDIIVAPGDDKQSCSNISRTPVCKKHHSIDSCRNSVDSKTKYKVKMGPWSSCSYDLIQTDDFTTEVQTALHPKIGVSQRNVSCIDEEGSEVDMSFCELRDVPPLIRQCVVTTDCMVSPWSEWHIKTEGCVATDERIYPETRTRHRRLLQLPAGAGAKPCPPLYEERTLYNRLPPCTKYQWYPLEWTDCQIMLHGNHEEITVLKPTCGNGLQYRNLTCMRINDMVPVDSILCKNPQPQTVQRCSIPCKRDCQVSHWARWGACRPFNNTGLFEYIEEGYRRRVRSVLVTPSNGGLPCPHLEELDKCDGNEIFDWRYGNWSECSILNPHASCGPGKRTRDKTCVNYDGVPINDFLCNHYHYPLDVTETCRVPCPNDCVMSQWSPWSECTHQCFTKKMSGEFFRNRTVLAIPGEGGRKCTMKVRENEDCNMNSCYPYRWKTSQWGPCVPWQGNEISSSFCGKGIQKREVACAKGSRANQSLHMCDFLTKPDSKRECYVPCPVDCVVSNFTEWTSCDGSCDSNSYRHRIILQSSRYEGKPCPEALVEARPCSSSLDSDCIDQTKHRKNITYLWDTGPWSDCELPLENQACGMGFQIRNVTCLHPTGRAVEPHFCLPTGWSSLPDGPIQAVPSALRSCEIVCSSNCAVSAWSSWSNCNYSYEAKRSRSRELVGISKSNDECLEKIRLREDELCPVLPVNSTDSVDDRWMSCIVDEGNRSVVAVNGQLVHHTCGTGYRYKVGFQMNAEMGVEPGLERDMCVADCPLDCQMTPWSEWSECDVPCGQGFRERRRRIEVPANPLGRPCPETANRTEVQRDVCNIACMDFHWVTGGWSKCILDDPDSDCGSGNHYRSVRCLNKRTASQVDESHCDPFLKPSSVEFCRTFCPGECVVSSWEITKRCSEPCTPENYQEMQRTVYRKPNSTAEPCPPLVSREPCVLNATCHEHSWELGPWSSCVLDEGAFCGKGVEKRQLMCLRSDGRQVDPIQCEKIHKPLSLEEPISKPCYIDCPVDCVMSEWSPWNKSSCSACGPIGMKTRTRRILQAASDAGQPCPTETEQRMPCDFRPCYHWKHSEWSQCDLEGASCGYGVRRRVVECVRFDHLKVDRSYCLSVNVTFPVNSWIDPNWLAVAQEDSREEELCHIPCPGDCIASQWSDWNHCHKNCRIGQKVGYQTSTRHVLFQGSKQSDPCPEKLWRTKPCWSDTCDMFAWKIRNNSYVCENKEGVIVQGGCTSEPRPCFSGCKQLGGTCESSTGECFCENGKGERAILGYNSKPCKVMGKGPRPPSNFSAPTPEIRLKYYPDDSQVSFWMYAMISIGTAFVIFVAVTVYLMCRSSLRQRTVSVERQPSLRRRLNGLTADHTVVESSPDGRAH